MRKITRTPAPEVYIDLVENNRPTNWSDFTQNHHALYREIRELILKDQLGTSGYTELPLTPDGNIHIDHFRKKGMFPDEEFNWDNFVVDERDNQQYGAGFKDKTVKAKDIYNKLISPVLDNPEQYLTYMEDGTIIPIRTLTEQDSLKAATTIDCFNLNHHYLRNRRQDMITTFKSLRQGNITKESVQEVMSVSGFNSLIDYVYNE